MKIQYILEEQELIKGLSQAIVEPAEGATPQHRRDREVYNVWKKNNSTTRIMLLSSMENDIM